MLASLSGVAGSSHAALALDASNTTVDHAAVAAEHGVRPRPVHRWGTRTWHYWDKERCSAKEFWVVAYYG